MLKEGKFLKNLTLLRRSTPNLMTSELSLPLSTIGEVMVRVFLSLKGGS